MNQSCPLRGQVSKCCTQSTHSFNGIVKLWSNPLTVRGHLFSDLTIELSMITVSRFPRDSLPFSKQNIQCRTGRRFSFCGKMLGFTCIAKAQSHPGCTGSIESLLEKFHYSFTGPFNEWKQSLRPWTSGVGLEGVGRCWQKVPRNSLYGVQRIFIPCMIVSLNI